LSLFFGYPDSACGTAGQKAENAKHSNPAHSNVSPLPQRHHLTTKEGGQRVPPADQGFQGGKPRKNRVKFGGQGRQKRVCGNWPSSIGHFVSRDCIRMFNEDVTDLFGRRCRHAGGCDAVIVRFSTNCRVV
jgi:lipoprotein-anchoring transpeptidase ErfK/SrfK